MTNDSSNKFSPKLYSAHYITISMYFKNVFDDLLLLKTFEINQQFILRNTSLSHWIYDDLEPMMDHMIISEFPTILILDFPFTFLNFKSNCTMYFLLPWSYLLSDAEFDFWPSSKWHNILDCLLLSWNTTNTSFQKVRPNEEKPNILAPKPKKQQKNRSIKNVKR